MNARVFVLVLVTGAFMAVWDTDRREMKVAVARQNLARISMLHTSEQQTTQSVAVETVTEVTAHSSAADRELSRGPEVQDAAETDALLTAAKDDNACGVMQEAAPGRFESTRVLAFGTDPRPESTPTFVSVGDVRVFGIPGEKPVDGEAVTATDSDVTISQSPDGVPIPKEPVPQVITVPRDLPEGTWTALNQSGVTFRITIERVSPGPESVDHFFVRAAPDGDRWCFVRAAAEPIAPVGPNVQSSRVSTKFWSPMAKQ
jgi:hypothetical protein